MKLFITLFLRVVNLFLFARFSWAYVTMPTVYPFEPLSQAFVVVLCLVVVWLLLWRMGYRHFVHDLRLFARWVRFCWSVEWEKSREVL